MTTGLAHCGNVEPVEPYDGQGVQFSQMPVGTRYALESFGYRGLNGTEYHKYTGVENGEHVMEIGRLRTNGSTAYFDYFAKAFYNDEGRLLRREFDNGTFTRYAPFDCTVVLGPCTHQIERRGDPNSRSSINESRSYDNSVSGNTVISRRAFLDGTIETTYTMGKYNYPVGFVSKTGLEPQGQRLVNIKEP